MKVRILEEAEADLVEGFQFYESKAKGLGDYFLDSLFSDIDSLQLFGGIHPLYFGYHRALSRRFPYAIYYRIFKKEVRVNAVLDWRRNPAKIEERLSE